MTLRPAAFLDRDGVLNRRPPPHDYVRSAEALELLPGVAGAVDALRAAGFATVVVSNQRGLARGLLTPETLAAIERRLAEAGVRIDAYYYCPHDLADGCDCRKPAPGLLLRAAAELSLDLGASVLVGDEETDVEAGRAAGCRTVLVGGAGGAATAADLTAPDLPAAVEAILAQTTPP